MHASAPTPSPRALAVAAAAAATVLLGAGPPAVVTPPPSIELGASAPFAVLAGGGITDAGPSVISGDAGSYPLPAVNDLVDRETTGAVHRADAEARRAQEDLARALASVAALTEKGTVNLAEAQTLPPGVYAVAGAGPVLSGVLTLDGQGAPGGVWVFLAGADLSTAPGSVVELVNGARACSVVWRVDGSATLAQDTTFVGTILAAAGVTVGHRVTVDGRLLARTAAVSLGGDHITAPACAAAGADPATGPRAVDGSRGGAARTGAQSTRPGQLPLLMMALVVAAAWLGEPRNRRPRRTRSRW
jgi:hypothetical protein